MESESELQILQEIYEYNVALYIGGGIYISTRSSFSIENSKFRRNWAFKDSAISALKTSSTKIFNLTNLLITDNEAQANTMSFKEADGILS